MLDNRFFSFDECENNVGYEVSTFSNLHSDGPSNYAIKYIKNEMKMRFFSFLQKLYCDGFLEFFRKGYIGKRSSH